MLSKCVPVAKFNSALFAVTQSNFERGLCKAWKPSNPFWTLWSSSTSVTKEENVGLNKVEGGFCFHDWLLLVALSYSIAKSWSFFPQFVAHKVVLLSSRHLHVFEKREKIVAVWLESKTTYCTDYSVFTHWSNSWDFVPKKSASSIFQAQFFGIWTPINFAVFKQNYLGQNEIELDQCANSAWRENFINNFDTRQKVDIQLRLVQHVTTTT